MNNILITVPEMAELLKVSRSKAYSLVKERNFPIIKIGKCLRVKKEELYNWLNNQ